MSEPEGPVYRGNQAQKKRRKYHLIPTAHFTAGATDNISFVFAGVAATVMTGYFLAMNSGLCLSARSRWEPS